MRREKKKRKNPTQQLIKEFANKPQKDPCGGSLERGYVSKKKKEKYSANSSHCWFG
jgi:hypothetical protein